MGRRVVSNLYSESLEKSGVPRQAARHAVVVAVIA